MSATVTRTTVAPQPAGSAKKPKGTPAALNTASKTKEADDLLAGMSMATSEIGNLTLAAASEKDTKQRAERDLEVERSKVVSIYSRLVSIGLVSRSLTTRLTSSTPGIS